MNFALLQRLRLCLPAGRLRRCRHSGAVAQIRLHPPQEHCILCSNPAKRTATEDGYGPRVDESVCMIDAADSNAVYYYHFDGLGSVVALTDANGTCVQTYEYSVLYACGVLRPCGR